jgi:hypothetical protein
MEHNAKFIYIARHRKTKKKGVKKRTLKPLSMNLTAYNSPLHFSLISFATPKLPDPISLIISYRSMVKLELYIDIASNLVRTGSFLYVKGVGN